jgi:hypothetical protein
VNTTFELAYSSVALLYSTSVNGFLGYRGGRDRLTRRYWTGKELAKRPQSLGLENLKILL